MKSKVVLYYKSLVQEGRNFILDDSSGNQTIQDYLDTLTSVEITDFQYIKHDLVVAIKLDMSQVNLELGNDNIDLNYVSITNYTEAENEEDEPTYEKTMYYFVAKKNWKATKTIELVLHMDTLNSCTWNSEYNVSAKTLVKRMHKDRFKKFNNRTIYINVLAGGNSSTYGSFYDVVIASGNGTIVSSEFVGLVSPNLSITECKFVYDNTNRYYFIRVQVTNSGAISHQVQVKIVYKSNTFIRLIDEKSEDISTPKFKVREAEIVDSKDNGVNWSLYYRNSDNQIDTSPVDCFLIPDRPIQLSYRATAGKITTSDVTSGQWLYFFPYYPNQPLVFKMGDWKATTGTEDKGIGGLRTIYYGVAIHNNSGTLELYGVVVDHATGRQARLETEYLLLTSGSEVEIENAPDTLYGDLYPSQVTNNDALLNMAISDNAPNSFSMPSATLTTLLDKASIDKTLSENIKIINIPFSPTPYERNGSEFSLAQCWSYDSGNKMIKLTDFSIRFKNEIVTPNESILNSYLYYQIPDVTDDRYVNDSKLFNSDFYQIKFVYDSFSKSFNLEALDFDANLSKDASMNFKFEFVMSRNLVSKFLFKFNFTYKLSTEDYDNIIYVARNNEEVLYSSQYLNYVRTGYNYDVKAKERQEEAYKTGLLVSGGTMLGSALLGVATGNPLALATGALGGMSFVGQMLSYARNQAQAEENIQRKLDETRRQAVSVLNADDYDLMYEYTSNKPKLCYYSVSNRMKQVLNDLFHYCGYTINEQMIPTINSRYWFNFVQAELVIIETANLTSEIEQDIKERFNQGVTFLHCNEINSVKTWDFDQEKENWEVSLLS